MTQNQPSRRRSERIELLPLVLGRIGTTHVAVKDLSVLGAGIQHQAPLPRIESSKLTFQWQNQELTLGCRIVRTRLEKVSHGQTTMTFYGSGLRFLTTMGDREAIIRKIIAEKVDHALQEQRANAFALSAAQVQNDVPDFQGVPPEELINLNELFAFRPTQLREYLCCTLQGTSWKRMVSSRPDQPESGFTVSAQERPEAIELLCKTYQNADAQGRMLIRTFAHVSVTEVSDVSPNRFRP